MPEASDFSMAKPAAIFANNMCVFVMGDNVRLVFTEKLIHDQPSIFRTSVMIPLQTFMEMREVLEAVAMKMGVVSSDDEALN